MGSYENIELVRHLERRRLLRWRIAAILFFALALSVTIGTDIGRHRHDSSRSNALLVDSKPHIARLVIRGVIHNDVGRVTSAIDAARQSKSITGLLVVVDSPGGGVTGGERLHDSIEKFAASKPVAVSMGDMGASAAYMLSVPAQHIVARASTLTGSIGVIMERPDVSTLLGHWGVNVDAITSGAMKDQTSPTSALTPDGRAMLQGIVNDLFDQFVEMVASGRHLSVTRVRELADGRAYTGRQALALNLVDEVGDEGSARAWMLAKLKVDSKYPVRPLLIPRASVPFHWYDVVLRHERQSILEWFVGTDIGASVRKRAAGLWLDGPVAILQL